jgi:hypothetical protein
LIGLLKTMLLAAVGALFLLNAACGGCGVEGQGEGEEDAGAGGDGSGADGGFAGCVGLQCQQVSCTPGTTTRLSGVVRIPAGTLPLPNVEVFVPNAPLKPIVEGVSCERCESLISGDPLVRARTDHQGRFTLDNLPAGDDIPLVLQSGKWRREIVLPKVEPCQDHPGLPEDQLRLPRNQSEGNLPRLALTTGGADALECLLRKVGIDPGEFTPESGGGRVNFFAGRNGTDRYDSSWNSGATFSPATSLWNTEQSLDRYDAVLFSCEGNQDLANKSTVARQAVVNYADKGGRIFASHWHNAWLQHGPAPFNTVASWQSRSNPPNPFTATIDTSFEKGKLLADWLKEVKPASAHGQIQINSGRRTVDGLKVGQRWIYEASFGIQYFTFNTPVQTDPALQCGRVVFTDIHVASGDDSSTSLPYPTGCVTTELTEQEMALIFMLFDLTACITPGIG